MKKTSITAVLIFIVILIIDQASKIWVKTHMIEGEEFRIFGEWARIHFVENRGMAFSMELPGQYGKLALSFFRFFAIGVMFYLLVNMIKEAKPKGLVYCTTAIIAGALGNLIDSMFYGKIFTDSYGQVASIFPPEGYAGWMQGNVVDMLWFPMIDGVFPTWLPIWGGEPFLFFSPIFNVADAAITTAIFIIIIFQKHFFKEEEKVGMSL